MASRTAARLFLPLALATAFPSPRARAQETTPPASPDAPAFRPRPRVALALSGGGARGMVHVGALRALEDNGIPIDAIAGTSMGSAVGALYAGGHRAQQLRDVVTSLDWQSIFSGLPDRRVLPISRRRDEPAFAGFGFKGWKVQLPASALSDYRVNRFFIEHLSRPGFEAGFDFDRLPIPFRAVATALDDGERIVFARGSLPRAVRASMSIPVAFPPVEWEGRPLVDGGLVDNLPVDVARDFGLEVVIAVDASSPDLEPSEYTSLIGIASQVANVLAHRVNALSDARADVTIRPDVGRHSFTDYTHIDELIQKGYDAVVAALPEIRAALRAAEERERGPAPEPTPEAPPPARLRLDGRRIEAVTVEGATRLDEALIRRTFNIPLGVPFELRKSLVALDKIHAVGFFDSIWMDLDPSDDDAGLRVRLRIREAAHNRVEVAAAFDENDKARGAIRFRNNNTLGFGEETVVEAFAGLASTGFEARLSGDRILPRVWIGFEARGYRVADKPRFFVDGEDVNRARFLRKGGAFSLRLNWKRKALFEAGLDLGRVEVSAEPGLPFAPRDDAVRTVFERAVWDRLDERFLPTEGGRVELRGEQSVTGLGASQDYWRASLALTGARPAGARGVVQLDGFAGLSGNTLPEHALYRLGGPTLLPGYHIQELWGPQAAAAALAYRVRVVGQLAAVARVGLGQVWQDRTAIRVRDLRAGYGLGLVHPSRFGPLAVDLGVAGEGRVLFTVAIGMF